MGWYHCFLKLSRSYTVDDHQIERVSTVLRLPVTCLGQDALKLSLPDSRPP